MFSRLNQLARHTSRSLPDYLHTSAFAPASRPSIMSSLSAAARERSTRTINTAACLIIGDEVLGGKTVDTNSAYLAKFCFSLGIALKRIEVIADDTSEIVEAVKRMSETYDFVITSGGIGPTHDDITYESIGKAFKLPMVEHKEAFERMKKLSRPHPSQPNFDWETPSAALTAKKRMIILPKDENLEDGKQVLFVDESLWVPIAVVNGNVHILPGVPRLFEKLLQGLKPVLLPRLTDPEGKGVKRIFFATPLAESAVAEYLTNLQKKVDGKGIKIGSYPRWGKAWNTVTMVGREAEYMESLVEEVEKGVEGKRVTKEDEGLDGSGGPLKEEIIKES